MLKEDAINIVIQINGKKRGLINTAKDTDENNIFDRINNDEKLSKYVEKTKIKNGLKSWKVKKQKYNRRCYDGIQFR